MTLNIPQANLSSKLSEKLIALRKQYLTAERLFEQTENAVSEWQTEHAAELLNFGARDLGTMITRANLCAEYWASTHDLSL